MLALTAAGVLGLIELAGGLRVAHGWPRWECATIGLAWTALMMQTLAKLGAGGSARSLGYGYRQTVPGNRCNIKVRLRRLLRRVGCGSQSSQTKHCCTGLA